jgi:hypothetical protein
MLFERQMPLMKTTHGWHKGDFSAIILPLLHLAYAFDNFHVSTKVVSIHVHYLFLRRSNSIRTYACFEFNGTVFCLADCWGFSHFSLFFYFLSNYF